MRVDGCIDITLTSEEQEYIKNDISAVKEVFKKMISDKDIKLANLIDENYTVNLADTVPLMLSEDWKDRFIAEYLQVKIRYNKLHKIIIKREVGKLDFQTPISLDSWKEQAHHMGLYLYELEKQAALHGIELSSAQPEQKEPCSLCAGLENRDTLYVYSDSNSGNGLHYIRDVKFCPVCGRRLNNG